MVISDDLLLGYTLAYFASLAEAKKAT